MLPVIAFLMGRDEEGTLTQLKAFRKTLVDPMIAAHRGRIVKTTGDGMLVEFASAVDAARCAVEVQRGVALENIDVPQQARIEFRIGIHVGDIIFDDNDIFGDGVNIAARLEGIAQPGGICISDDAQRQIRGKLDSPFEDMGPQNLKNIAEPMRAWRLSVDAKSAEYLSAERSTGLAQALTLPDKPSIAVLPFQNKSSDPEPMAWWKTSSQRYRGTTACSSSRETRASPIKGKRLTSSGWAANSASVTFSREAFARSPAGFG